VQLRQYAFIVWRWLWLVVLGTALASGAAYFANRRMTPVYTATATIRINLKSADASSMDYNSVILSEELLQTYSELLRMPDVLDPAGARLSWPMTGEELAGRVQVKSVRNTQLLDVTVQDTDPALAAESANAIAEVLKERNEREQLDRFVTLKDSLGSQMAEAEQSVAATQVELDALRGPLSPTEEGRRAQLQTTLAQYRSNLVSLTDNLTQVRLAEAQATNGVIIVQNARAPAGPIRPRTLTNTLLAAVVGALLALGEC